MNQANHPPVANNTGDSPPIPELRDIILPEQVYSYWIAPGWLLVIVLALLATGTAVYFWLQYRRNNEFRRQALAELKQWLSEQADSTITPDKLVYLSTLLKRVTVATRPALDLADLHSNYWQTALKSLAPQTLDDETSQLLAYGGYRQTVNTGLTLQQLADQCQRWIKRYRPKQAIVPGASNA